MQDGRPLPGGAASRRNKRKSVPPILGSRANLWEMSALLLSRLRSWFYLLPFTLRVCFPTIISHRTGKEAIATVGVRIGRTAAHMALYLCSSLVGGAPPQRALMGVALAAAAAWAVTLRKVEALAKRTGGEHRASSSAPPLPPPPSEQQAGAAGNGVLPSQLEVEVDSASKSPGAGVGVSGGRLRRRDVGARARAEEVVNGSPAADGSHAAAQASGNGGGRKEL